MSYPNEARVLEADEQELGRQRSQLVEVDAYKAVWVYEHFFLMIDPSLKKVNVPDNRCSQH